MAYSYLPPDLYLSLFERDHLSILPRQVFNPELTSQINNLKLADGSEAARVVISGLHLLNDDVKNCHQIAENLHDNGLHEADYIHALSHIRDADWGNARWWFRRLQGHEHPLLTQTFKPQTGETLSMEEAAQKAKEFVDACEHANQIASSNRMLEQELYGQIKAAVEYALLEKTVKQQN